MTTAGTRQSVVHTWVLSGSSIRFPNDQTAAIAPPPIATSRTLAVTSAGAPRHRSGASSHESNGLQ